MPAIFQRLCKFPWVRISQPIGFYLVTSVPQGTYFPPQISGVVHHVVSSEALGMGLNSSLARFDVEFEETFRVSRTRNTPDKNSHAV